MIHEQGNSSLVSIIIPLYNVEDYIERTLISIDKQIYKNIEVVVIDDGSTDKSYEVTEKYLSKCNFKYCLCRQDNAGVSAARNKGLSIASGQYIVFVDSDDVLSPYYVMQMYEQLNNNNNINMAICGHYIFEDDNAIGTLPQTAGKIEYMSSLDMMEKFMYGTIKISIWTIMVRRDLINNFGIKFAEGYKYSEDIHFVWRLLAHIDRVVYDQTPLYYYRMRPLSAMAKFNESRLDGMYLMQQLEGYFKEHCKQFAEKFLRYGVARWVWATMWQSACALPYDEFEKFCLKLHSNEKMKSLKSFPNLRVRLSSQVFIFSKYAYYLLSRTVSRLYNISRF